MKKTVLSNSILSEQENERSFPIEKVLWSRTKDIKGNSYSDNRTIFDLQFQNNTYYTDLASGYIVEGLQTTVVYSDTGSTDPARLSNDMALTLKSSVLEYLNTITIWLNDIQVNNPTQFMNLACNFELLKKSNEDIKLLQDLILYQKNSVESIRQESADNDNAPANCEYNNDMSSAFTSISGSNFKSSNYGRRERLLKECLNFARTETIGVFMSDTQCDAVHQNHMTNVSGNVDVTLTYKYYAVIPLSLLSDFFVKCPILRGFKLKVDIQQNFNFAQKITVKNKAYTGLTTSNSASNGVCPYMISPIGIADADNVGLVVRNVAVDIIVSVTCSVIDNFGTYIHLPQIFYNAFYSNKILEAPKKTILWNDYVVYPSINELKNVSKTNGQVVNALITQSVIRPRALLLIPYSYANVGGTKIANYQSPFTSQPATTAPFCRLTNVNVAINDIGIHQQNFDYTYQHFMEFLNSESNTGLNMKLNGLMTGQISKFEWEKGYCYYYFDLTQFISSIGDDDLGKSIKITFTNQSNQDISFFAIVFSEKECEINRVTGEFVKKL